jgi:hypothetical protein
LRRSSERLARAPTLVITVTKGRAPAIFAFFAADDGNAHITLRSSPPEVVAQPLAGGAATTLARDAVAENTDRRGPKPPR